MEIIVITFAAGLACFILRNRGALLPGALACIASLVSLFFAVRLFINKQLSLPAQFFKLDNLNIFIAPFVCLFGFLIVLYSLGYINTKVKRPGEYYSYLLWAVCVSYAAVLANNLALFLLMWGAGAFLLYLLVGIQGGDEASSAAKKTLIIVGGSDAIMFLGAAIMWKLSGTLNMDGMHIAVTGMAGTIAFLCLLTGAMAKAGAIHFHTWIPDAGSASPVSVMAALPASLDKLLGIYLIAKCVLYIFTIQQYSVLSIMLMLIGAVTIIGAVMMALVQHNFKRLLSYHAVSQVGYMILGIGSATTIGIAGGLFHMLNHAIYKSCLFLSCGNVEHATGESDLDKMGGLAKLMPVTFITCLIASLSISGVPPFNGFFSKWMIYQGLIQILSEPGARFTAFLCLMAAMFGSALTLASFMKLLHAMFLGRKSPGFSEKKIKEVPWNMRLSVMILASLCVIFGIFAVNIPLKNFIFPVTGEIQVIGSYAPFISTALIILGIAFGLAIYFFGGARKLLREDTAFIGGETLPAENKISGAEFYANIKELQVLKNIYNSADKGGFDIYEQFKGITLRVGKIFQYLHNGVLPTYMVWTLLGMIVLFFTLMR